MSSKRSSLFGGRPDLLLVDERPPGISLPELSAAPTVELEDEPEEPFVEFDDDDDDDDDDSYDGDGPLRIFIGSPKAEEPAEPDEEEVAAAAAPSLLAETGPVWDASALALGADDDIDDVAEDTHVDRGPVLIKAGGSIEPPPLTMSFGGSFSRGSLDAGVMDEESVGDIESVEPTRSDTVVVHDQIYDRFLRFEDPTEPPPATDAPDPLNPSGSPSDDHVMLAAAAEEDDSEVVLAIGQVPDDVEPGPPPTRLALGHTLGEDDDDDEYDDDDDDDDAMDSGLQSLGSSLVDTLDDSSEPLRARIAPPVDDDDDDDDDEDSGLHSLGPSLADDEDELTSPATPRVIISDQLPGLGGLSGKNLAQNEDEIEERPIVPPPPTELPRTAPEWAVRRRVSRDGDVQEGDDAQGSSESSGTGLLIFVVIAVLAVLAAWWFIGRPGVDTAADGPTDTPTEQASVKSKTPAAGDPAPVGTDPAPVPPETTDAPDAGVVEFIPEGSDAADRDPADLGILRVRATRPSRVYVDGQLVGETPMSAISVPSGEHSVKVVAIDSGRARSQSVRVDAGRAQEVRFTF